MTRTPIKEYIAKMFLNKTFNFKCDCAVPMDVTGTVVDYEIVGSELVLIVQIGEKYMHIGLNTYSLTVEEQ